MGAMLSTEQETIYPWVQGDGLLTQGQATVGQLLVDVRTPSEFGEAHIPGSRNIPLADLHKFLAELKVVANDRAIILVCRTQNRVKIAYDHLLNSGITNCRILDGGITTWMAAGNPVIRGSKGFSPERQVRLIAGTLVVLGVGLGVSVSPWFLIIPAAVGAGLFHAGATDSCLMATILTKLPFNRIHKGATQPKSGNEDLPENKVT